MLNEWERIDDLQCDGLRIIQDTRGFCFGVDAVLLANFAMPQKGAVIVDFCSGCGVIPTLLYAKTNASQIHAVEILPCLTEMFERSIALNSMSDRVFSHCCDIRYVHEIFPSASVDYITCNPPYFKKGAGFENSDQYRAMARHETMCSLEDILKSASKILRYGGKIAMVHKADRLTDVMCTMRQFKIEPKRLSFFSHSPDKPIKLVLLEAMVGARPGLKLSTAKIPI